MSEIKCTIITPVYNRAYTVERLYNSLRNQTVKNFEWLIIDDGSTEDTGDLWVDILNEQVFPVRYYKKENGGKHTALNFAMDYVESELCFIVDTDDFLPSNSLERVYYWYESIKDTPSIAGVGGMLQNIDDDNAIGTSFQGESLICKSSERSKNGISGDKAEVFKTEILRQFPFPEFPGEKFLSESIVWNAVSEAGYDILWFNECIYKAQYLEGGLTDNLMEGYRKSPKGFALYLKSLIHQEKVSKLREYYYYGMYKNIVGNLTNKEVALEFDIRGPKVMCGDVLYKLKNLIR